MFNEELANLLGQLNWQHIWVLSSRSQKTDQLGIINIYRAQAHINTNSQSGSQGQLHWAAGKIINAHRIHQVLRTEHISQLSWRRKLDDVTAFAHCLTRSKEAIKKWRVIKASPKCVAQLAVKNGWQMNHALQFRSEVGGVKWQPVVSKFWPVQFPFCPGEGWSFQSLRKTL